MKTCSFAFAALVSLFACGCVGVDVQPTAGSPAQKPDQPAPSITLSLNCLGEATIAPGSPILIEVALSTPDGRDSGTSVFIANDAGPWSELLKVEIRDSQNQIVPGLGLQPLFTTEGSITLNGETLGTMAWAVTSEAANALPPGEYSVVAVLDTQTSSSAWKGKTSSGPSALTVKATPADLNENEARLVALADVRINGFLGDHDTALSLVEAYLGDHPKDGLMLEERADTLAKAGKFAEAVVAYDAALANVAPQDESPLREPPHLLLHKRALAAEAAKADSQSRR